ncbi:MAG TPA: hypothetical protein VKQ05_04900 [Gemmatimonadales bacterium]|nr:hypothetical protein [Gemmatimonadales bacterium]
MQRAFVLLAILATATTRAQAQRSWQTEFGMQGGFTRLVDAGSRGGRTDALSLPGFNLGNLVPSAAGLYITIPWTRQLAIESDIAASQFSSGPTLTVLTLGLRGDYALTRELYGAAGGALAYNNGVGENETQLGVHGALGFRHRLTRSLNARLEARATVFRRASNAQPRDVYSVLFGVSTSAGGARGARAAGAPASRGAWTAGLGIAGGYANVHVVRGPSLTALAFPVYGGALGPVLATEVTMPATLFAIIPIANRIAIEPGVDIHRFQESGRTDFTGNLSARFDYAVHGGWYGALGGNLHYIKTTGASGGARSGVNLGWGYRFPFVAAIGGRVEMNYTLFAKNLTLGTAATNTFGLLFGATMPLK